MIGLLIGPLVSQGLWAKTYGGTGSDLANSVTRTSDGGCAVAGTTESFGAGGSDFLVIRLNPDGSIAWAKTYGGTGNDAAYSIIQTTDGGFAVAGATSLGAGGNDFLIAKLNPNGTVAWAKTYGGTGTDVSQSIIQTTDGGYAIAGYSSLGAGNYDFLVLRLNTDGSLVWAKTFGSQFWELACSITQTTDGGFAIAGNNIYDYYAIVVKLDSDGGFSWAKRTQDGIIEEWVSSIAAAPDGGCVLVGGRLDCSSENYQDALLFKLDASGDVSWCKIYPYFLPPFADDRAFYSIIPTSDGGFATTGSDPLYFFFFKLNVSGTPSWARTLPVGAPCIAQTIDGGFVLAGNNWTSTSSYDFIVFKVDPDGSYPGCVPNYSFLSLVDLVFPIYSLSGLGTPSLSTSDPELITSSPTLTITDYCEPLYEDVGEIASGPRPGITCSPVPGGVLFLSHEETPLRIYASDGRLVYSGKLMKGQNRILLDRGVYFWQAGSYKGKVVVK